MGVRWKPFILCCLTNRLRGFSSAPGRGCRHKGTRLRRCNLKRKAPAPSPLFLQKRMQVIENKALLSETTRLPISETPTNRPEHARNEPYRPTVLPD